MGEMMLSGLGMREIQYDPRSLRERLLAVLEDWNGLFLSEAARGIVGTEFLKQQRESAREVRRRLDAPFSLVVMGDFKRGKSTLINALVGVEAVTTDVLPETITINHLNYGEAFGAELVFPGGGKLPLRRDELRGEVLAQLLKRLPQPPSYLSIHVAVDWLKSIEVVDTPGLGDLMQRFDAQVHEYLPRADALIYVISALSPLSESERLFLQLAVRPLDFAKILFVVNMLDAQVRPEESQRLVESIRAKLERFFPGAPVFGVSALDEFLRLNNLPRPRPERAEELAHRFHAFREHLDHSVFLNRDLVQLERVTWLARNTLALCTHHLDNLDLALQGDLKALDAAIAQCQNQDSDLHQKIEQHKQRVTIQVQQLGEQSVGWMNGFLDRLEQQVIDHLKEYNQEDLQRYFSFFLTENIHAALAQCLDTHQADLLASLKLDESLFRGASQNAMPSPALDNSLARVSFDPGSWTVFDNLYLISFFTGLGPVLDLIVGVANKQLNREKKVASYQDQIIKAVPDLRQSVEVEVRKLYGDIARKISDQLDSAYQQQIESSLATLTQAVALRQAGEGSTTAALQWIEDTGVQLRELVSQIDHLQARLSEPPAPDSLTPEEGKG